ncbi:sensor histidine kinase [Dactylosporangium aurantiacum]|uniref:histidine kinase n=1 Tax=Dactylosporangium aurantiacum TaxID=35754 RepID=A0A9Q9IE90_9ACTN|nr:sensor histidine kinase [Dactylosporangium aurantiacum]MDG6105068.1 sensor histidine kinase [Dactylosporangium aurantiacum]UWZ51598.1 sensor histidine kinase [Dactylosporangium aurantiacum]
MNALLLTRRLRPLDLYLVDAVLALVFGVALCAYAAQESPLDGGVTEPTWLSVLTGAVIGLPVAARRRFPVGAAVTVSLATTVALATGVIPNYAAAGPSVSLALTFYTLAVATPLRRSLPTAATCLAAVVAALAMTGGDLWSASGAVLYGMVMTTPGWLIGWTVRERRALAARQSEQATRQAVAEERLRIARELHDIVAHTMSLIVVKAAVGNHVAEANPREAREALRVIEATGRGALLEMRRALGMLRDDTPYAPAPGLADLEALAGQASYGDVQVRLEVTGPGPPEAVPESVGLAAYRIVQEALTNVVKHAAPAMCRVTVDIGPADVRVDVTDDGRRPVRVQGSGHGLIGMRERVASHDGEFSAGPREGGGFAVSARLPYAPVEVSA